MTKPNAKTTFRIIFHNFVTQYFPGISPNIHDNRILYFTRAQNSIPEYLAPLLFSFLFLLFRFFKNPSTCLQFEKFYKHSKNLQFSFAILLLSTSTHIPKAGIQLLATVPLADYDPLLSPLSTTQVTCLCKPTTQVISASF
jgi:hypothetical protein